MKPIQKIPSRIGNKRGFALVVTLTLMVLLSILALGLLSLSSVALRSATHAQPAMVAQANARMALMLAIGELQKTAGHDKAITATSGIIAEVPGKPNLSGIWRSWDDFRPDLSPDYNAEKAHRFQGWLVSSSDPARTSQSFVTSGWNEKTIELVGSKTLGGDTDPAATARAGLISIVRNGKREGSYAWHVADESVKARINLPRDPSLNGTLAQKRALVAGHRPTASLVSVGAKSLDFLPKDLTTLDHAAAKLNAPKLVDLNQHNLLPGGGEIGRFRNDVTPYSSGLLTDVRRGGLKQDLTSIFEAGGMPAQFAGKLLYQSTHGITGISDPHWSALASYYNSYKQITGGDSNPTYYRAPTQAITINDLAPPTDFYAAPVIAKVEMLYTFVVRDSHGPWINNLKNTDPKLKYMGHLIYTPIVTLHNPYNVNLQFDRMLIKMENVPVGFNFFVNGQPQNKSLVSLNSMFTQQGAIDKGTAFSIDIANWPTPSSTTPSGSITMKPGQTLLCSPYFPDDWAFKNGDDGASNRFFNWRNDLANNIRAKPGFRGKAVGYDVDWLTPNAFKTPAPQQSDGSHGVLGLRDNEQVSIECGALLPPSGKVKDRFVITAEITSGGKSFPAGGLSFVYGNQATLDKMFPEKFRFPRTGALPISAMYVPNSTLLKNYVQSRAFAVFSVYGRAANGGVYETDSRVKSNNALNVLHDGRLAGKPFLHHNPAKPVVTINLASEKPGNQSHEMNFQSLDGEVDDHFEVDVENRVNYLLTHKGNVAKSIKSGSYFELPSGPMQAISDFRRSNALTSSYLPNFVQPVGNSYSSPLISTSSVKESGVTSYELLDHSVLANHALYDSFYFSTIAPTGGADAASSFQAFMEGSRPLASQNFKPYRSSGKTIAQARGELFSGSSSSSDAYRLAAEYQMVEGAFNVNSTSVQAWKAVLGAMKGSEIPVLWARSGRFESSNSDKIPIPAMSLHNAGLDGTSADIGDTRTAEWNAFRELSDSEIETLAENIVAQVRKRGPFLTMSEFVNRRVGPDSEFTRMGILQQAIEESNINDTVFKTQVPISQDDLTNNLYYDYRNPAAMEGNPAAGAPGWISQADLLKIIEPAATVRSDTFVIRAYGEATDSTGAVLARAYAEAVVQRVPDYVDPSDRPSLNVYDAGGSLVNRTFGRRIDIVSFRWLSPDEI